MWCIRTILVLRQRLKQQRAYNKMLNKINSSLLSQNAYLQNKLFSIYGEMIADKDREIKQLKKEIEDTRSCQCNLKE